MKPSKPRSSKMNQSRPLSKMIAWVITCVMVLTLAPATAFAGQTPPGPAITALANNDAGTITALANTTVEIVDSQTIVDNANRIQGAILDASNAGSGNTVTVTGSKTGMSVNMNLMVPSGVTLIWQASLSGDTTTNVPLLTINGSGNFRMESGILENAETNAITFRVNVDGSALITGNAQIRTTGTNGGALSPGCPITINGNAQIIGTGTQSSAILAAGDVTVGDNVQISGYVGIHASEGTTVRIGGNSSVTGVYRAINTGALGSSANVEVSGGTVRSTGGGSDNAIYTLGDVTVSGGELSSVDSYAIRNSGNVNISGGTISSANNYAIFNEGSTSVVTVSGGTVTGAAAQTIWMYHSTNTAQNVIVSGSGKVFNTDAGHAINSYGGVRVEGNALVTAKTGNAIRAKNVTVAGGAVFAYGTEITGTANVVQTTAGGSYTAPTTNNGIVVAWDSAAGITNYAQGSFLHITAQPSTATAFWSDSGGIGIQYTNGTQSGLIPVSGVTIGQGNILPAVTSVGISAGSHDFPAVGAEIEGTYTYNLGTGNGGGEEMGSVYKWYRGSTATWGGGHTEISGATDKTYTPTYEDIGKYLYFEVAPSNGGVTGATVHSAASAQAGVLIKYVPVTNGTTGAPNAASQLKVISATSPKYTATLNNALSVTWTVSEGGGTFTNQTALNPGYALPVLSTITEPITITATFTPDTYAPVLSAVSVNGTTDRSAVLNFTSDKAGTYYYLVYADNAEVPNADTIKAQGTVSPTVANGSASVTRNSPKSITMTGLAESTPYKVYVVVTDAAGNTSSVSTADFTTVALEIYGLVFDVTTGKMTLNGVDYTDQSWSWDSGTKTLTLTNFNWVTTAAAALQIKNGSTYDNVNVTITLNINGANSFISTYNGTGNTWGIVATPDITLSYLYLSTYSYPLKIMGTGSLEATGGTTTGTGDYGYSWGILARSFALESGTVSALGGSAATRSYGIATNNGSSVVGQSVAITGGELTARASTAGGSSATAFSGIYYNNQTAHVTFPVKYRYKLSASGSEYLVPPAAELDPSRTAWINYTYFWIKSIPLSTEKAVTTIAGQDISSPTQTGTSDSPEIDAINVANTKATLSRADIAVSTDATFNLYSDSGFDTEVTGDDSIALILGGATIVYIKVTAEDTSEAYYAITVNRAPPTIVDIAEIPGVTLPAYGETPVVAITETTQYTGTVAWSPAHNPFKANRVYTATITLTPKSGYTFTGVTSDAFAVYGAAEVTNAAGSGVVTAVFPAMDAPAIAVSADGLSGFKVGVPFSGGTVTYTLSTGIYAVQVTAADFALTNLPAGLSTGTVTRTSDTVVTVAITGTPTTANAGAVTLDLPNIPARNVQDAVVDVVPTGTITADTVAKGDGLAATNRDISIASADVTQHDFDLDNIALNKANPGERSYALDTFTDSTGVLDGAPSLGGTNNATLSYTGNGKTTGTATQTITISTANYEDTSVTITFNAIEKYAVTIEVTMTGGEYKNSAYAYSNLVVKKASDDSIVTGVIPEALYESTDGGGYNSATAPTNAGAYKLTLSIPAGNSSYTGSAVFNFTITPKPLTIKADDKSAKVGESQPAYTYTVTGLLGNDTLTTVPTLACTPDMSKPGTYPITISGAEAGANYTISYQSGALTVSATTVDDPNHDKSITDDEEVKIAQNVTKIRTPLTTVNITKGKKLTPPIEFDDGKVTVTKVAGKTFKSSNTKVVTVNPKTGAIKGIKAGTAKITVTTANGKTLTIKVNVVKKAVKLKKFTLTGVKKNALSLKKGKTKDLKIKLAQSKASDLKVTFKSNKKSVVKVDNAGRITAVKKGKATITVKVGSKTVKVKVTVK